MHFGHLKISQNFKLRIITVEGDCRQVGHCCIHLLYNPSLDPHLKVLESVVIES